VLPAAGLHMGLGPAQPEQVGEEALGQAVAAHHALGERHAGLGEPDGAGVDGDEVGLLHAADHLGHGRARDLEALGDAGLDDLDVVLAQLEDGLAVLLEGRVPFPRLVRCHGQGVYASHRREAPGERAFTRR